MLAERIPGAWLVQIKGGGHGVLWQYPEEFDRVLQTFLTTDEKDYESWSNSTSTR
jgi:pimeloyl-ACP methyl ester carboxylesterase